MGDVSGLAATVLGAGIGGLTAAIALAQQGARVRVLEQAERITEVGAGIQISPNGACVLERLGLGPDLVRRSMASKAVVLRDYRRGRPVVRLDLQGRGRFALVHRADLIALLADAADAAGVVVETGRRVEAVEIAETATSVRFSAGGSERLEGVVIGADGLHSRLRAAMLGPAAPQFTGQVAWRALLACDGGAVPAEAHVFMAPGRHVVAYPLRDGRLVNLVAVEERAAWTDEGWTHRGEPGDLRRAFAGFGEPVAGWLQSVEDVHVWGLFRHPVAARWGQGRCCLLGDAAHPTLPFLAQGACMAIEDAWALSVLLDRHGPTPRAWAAYTAARRDRVGRIVAAATANARNYHLRHPLVRGIAHGGLRVLGAVRPGVLADRFDWLYGYDVTTAV